MFYFKCIYSCPLPPVLLLCSYPSSTGWTTAPFGAVDSRSSCSAAATAQGDCVGHLGADGTVAQLAHDGHVGKGHGEGGEDEGEDEVGVHEESLLEDANVIVPTALVVGHIVYHRLDGVDVRYGNGAVHDARNPNDRNDEIGVVLQQAVHLGQGMQCRHVPLNADRAQSDWGDEHGEQLKELRCRTKKMPKNPLAEDKVGKGKGHEQNAWYEVGNGEVDEVLAHVSGRFSAKHLNEDYGDISCWFIDKRLTCRQNWKTMNNNINKH